MTVKRLVERLTEKWDKNTSYRIAKELGTTPYIVDAWCERVPKKRPVKNLGSHWLKILIDKSDLSDKEIVKIIREEG